MEDTGPGIPDIDKAMEEGYSTASEKVRELGFGAGMGLPNIKRNSDFMNIESKVGVGTKVTIKILI
jgi:anti-sigma regulatory factor (Ser/Thr protein kinase)